MGTSTCVDCGQSHNQMFQGRVLPRCVNCFKIFRNRNATNNYNRQTNISAATTVPPKVDFRDKARAGTAAGIQDVINELIRQRQPAFLSAIGASEANIQDSTDTYRIIVVITNPANGRQSIGLIDTGANSSVCSVAGLKDLQIDPSVTQSETQAYSVSGECLDILGRKWLSVQVGKVAYANNFEVLQNIQGYNFILGTDFLRNTDIFKKIYHEVANEIGHESTALNF